MCVCFYELSPVECSNLLSRMSGLFLELVDTKRREAKRHDPGVEGTVISSECARNSFHVSSVEEADDPGSRAEEAMTPEAGRRRRMTSFARFLLDSKSHGSHGATCSLEHSASCLSIHYCRHAQSF